MVTLVEPPMLNLVIKKPFSGLHVGKQIAIPCDADGIPKEQFWRRRLRDSKIDGCVEVIDGNKSTSSAKPAESKEKQSKTKSDKLAEA